MSDARISSLGCADVFVGMFHRTFVRGYSYWLIHLEIPHCGRNMYVLDIGAFHWAFTICTNASVLFLLVLCFGVLMRSSTCYSLHGHWTLHIAYLCLASLLVLDMHWAQCGGLRTVETLVSASQGTFTKYPA